MIFLQLIQITMIHDCFARKENQYYLLASATSKEAIFSWNQTSFPAQYTLTFKNSLEQKSHLFQLANSINNK